MKRYIIADLHFGHKNIIAYENRPFESVDEMDAALIRDWNAVVGRKDIVYVLGDFTLTRNLKKIKRLVKRLHGTKVLIMGNHDTRKPEDYVKCGFRAAIRKPIMVDPGVILMHEPFNDAALIYPRYCYFFGHVHGKHTMMDDYKNCKCVSVERINYTPIDLDKAIKEIRTKNN